MMTNYLQALMTLLTQLSTLENVEEGLKEACAPLRTWLFNKMMASSWNDVIEDDTNEEIVQVLGTDDGGNIREEPNIGHLALPNVISDEVTRH